MTPYEAERSRYLRRSDRPRRRTSDEASNVVRLFLAIPRPLLDELEQYAAARRVSRSMAAEQLLAAGLASELLHAAIETGLAADPHRLVVR